MKNKKKIFAGVAVAASLSLALVGCSSAAAPAPNRAEQLSQSQQSFSDRTPPNVTGDAEYNNYVKAQEEVYDDPATIIWCTSTWANTQAPIFTVPIAGKLTSSSVSYYPNQTLQSVDGGEYNQDILVEAQSVDGMYHGSPAPYRYGFTPGGQYVDFSGMEVFCTTQLTEFQRQTLQTATVAPEDALTGQAEELLKAGDAEGAQKLLDGITGE